MFQNENSNWNNQSLQSYTMFICLQIPKTDLIDSPKELVQKELGDSQPISMHLQ